MKACRDKLKAIQQQVRAQARTAPPACPAPEPEPDFRALHADVRPLKPHGRVSHPSPRPKPYPRKTSPAPALTPELERELMRHLSGCFEPVELPQRHTRHGVPSATLQRLQDGHWPVVATLDLHGLDRDGAQSRLLVFLHQARTRGHCVRVVHGKGLGSSGEPVLKKMVRLWLQQHPHVLAFCEAPPDQGGAGALLVLLKRQFVDPDAISNPEKFR